MRDHVLRVAALAFCLSSIVAAQPPSPSQDAVMSFEDYEPRSTLVVPEHPLTRARYPPVSDVLSAGGS